MIPSVRERRKIDGISAVFLPYAADGRPDFAEFSQHLARTTRAGLTPAVNMDTGFGPQLSPAERQEILKLTREVLGAGPAFVAGAMPFGDPGDPLAAYRTAVRNIVAAGGTPIVFPSEFLGRADGAEAVRLHREIIGDVPRALAFELGEMFAPFGRIWDLDTFKRLLEIPNLAGLKHSSLRREPEFARLAIRDRERPGFRVYTGNDLAIDMVMYGSDYLLGLSAFDPKAFAHRDAWWEAGDPRFFDLNDALQAVGAVAFRDPVPAYKDSAAVYLKLTGKMRDPHPHPACPRRPAWEAELLAPLAARVAAAMG
ncbi:MAG: dihydrodipicolinate synthase family protein [Candidatus Coatesbacteria bacterium]